MENPQPAHTNQIYGSNSRVGGVPRHEQDIPMGTRQRTDVVLRQAAHRHERKAVALNRLASLVDGSMDGVLTVEVRKMLDEALYDLVF